MVADTLGNIAVEGIAADIDMVAGIGAGYAAENKSGGV